MLTRTLVSHCLWHNGFDLRLEVCVTVTRFTIDAHVDCERYREVKQICCLLIVEHVGMVPGNENLINSQQRSESMVTANAQTHKNALQNANILLVVHQYPLAEITNQLLDHALLLRQVVEVRHCDDGVE